MSREFAFLAEEIFLGDDIAGDASGVVVCDEIEGVVELVHVETTNFHTDNGNGDLVALSSAMRDEVAAICELLLSDVEWSEQRTGIVNVNGSGLAAKT